MRINTSKLTPFHEMPAITRDDIIRFWTQNGNDAQVVSLCRAALDSDSAARDQLTYVMHTEWRAAELDILSPSHVVINDIDGNCAQLVDCGLAADVRQRFSLCHPIHSLINRAIVCGTAEATYEIDGEEYTTQVVTE